MLGPLNTWENGKKYNCPIAHIPDRFKIQHDPLGIVPIKIIYLNAFGFPHAGMDDDHMPMNYVMQTAIDDVSSGVSWPSTFLNQIYPE